MEKLLTEDAAPPILEYKSPTARTVRRWQVVASMLRASANELILTLGAGIALIVLAGIALFCLIAVVSALR